jgi:hypothetical protein
VYDNETPTGRFVDTRDHRTYPQEQAQTSARGTRPACPSCGWTMQYVSALQETDWRNMHPDSPTWEAETDSALRRLAAVKADRLANGLSLYYCAKCGGQGAAQQWNGHFV